MESVVGSGDDAEPERVCTEHDKAAAHEILALVHQARAHLNDAEFRIQRVITRGLIGPDIYSQARACLGLAESACYAAGEVLIEADPRREPDTEFRDWTLGIHDDDATSGTEVHRDA